MSDSRDLREMERLLIALHKLMIEGRGESDDADQIRDAMDGVGHRLDERERRLVANLSADLYMIEGEELVPEARRTVDPVRARKMGERAFLTKRWEEVLEQLRSPRGAWAEDVVAYVRARCWSELGFHEGAVCFYDHAYSLNPKPNYLALSLDEYAKTGQSERMFEQVQRIEDDPSSHPTVLLKAALILFDSIRSRPELPSESVDRRVVRLVERARSHPRQNESVPSLRAGGGVAAGFSSEHMGHKAAARIFFDDAVAIRGGDAELVARGLVLMAGEPESALRDFQRALDLKTTIVWPYLYLAHQALESGDYGKVAPLASRGVDLTRDGKVRARLFEWWAIAYHHMGHDRAAVGALFDAAVAEDPFDSIIESNAKRFRELVATGSAAPGWDTSEGISLDEVMAQMMQQTSARKLVSSTTLPA